MSKLSRFGNVDSQYAPGNITITKIIRRLADISATSPGTEINLSNAGEIQLYADFPVDIIVGESGVVRPAITSLRLGGNIERIFVTRPSAFAHGRLTIFIGVPNLGTDFEREDPKHMAHMIASPGVPIVWAAGNASQLAQTVTFPILGGVPVEAMYVHALECRRDVGTIDRIRFNHSDGGVGLSVIEALENPSDVFFKRFSEPIRLPYAGTWTVEGSVEAVNTNITRFNVELSLI